MQDKWAVAAIGTRPISPYGLRVTEELAFNLARSGMAVISGLGRVVDGVAHERVLKSGGRAIAVLGCGIDRVSPPGHTRLVAMIVANEALISDYSPGTPSEIQNFPPRNRITSEMSIAVVVAERNQQTMKQTAIANQT